MLSLRISQSFLLDTLSGYMLDTLPMALLHRVKLTARQKIRTSQKAIKRPVAPFFYFSAS